MFIKLVNYAPFLWLPFYLSEGLGVDKSLSSLMATRFDLGFICGAILAGLLSDVTTHWAGMPMRSGEPGGIHGSWICSYPRYELERSSML